MNFSVFVLLFLCSVSFFQTACTLASSADAPIEQDKPISSNRTQVGTDVPPSTNARAKVAQTPKPIAKKPANEVCADPSKPCNHDQKTFDDWELSFHMPARLGANKTYTSAPFYAVIVKNYEEGCGDLDENPAVEPERLKLQKRFTTRKVFAQYSCPNMSAVGYDFAGRLDAAGETVLYMDFIAVYAGATKAEANELRDELLSEFPNAEVKRMTANFGIIEQ